jgi:hypothetical protein
MARRKPWPPVEQAGRWAGLAEQQLALLQHLRPSEAELARERAVLLVRHGWGAAWPEIGRGGLFCNTLNQRRSLLQ